MSHPAQRGFCIDTLPPNHGQTPPPLPGPPTPPPSPLQWAPSLRPWGFWATVAWTLLIIGVMMAVQTAVLAGMAMAPSPSTQGVHERLVGNLGLYYGLAVTATAAVCIPLTCALVRLRNLPIARYLGLRRLRLWPLVKSYVALAATLFLVNLAFQYSGRNIEGQDVSQIVATARFVPLLLFALVVCAPAFEEILFRGFMFRGMAASAGPAAAILLTSMLWSGLHYSEYNFWGLFSIFCLGLLLGAVRWFTSSTLITMLLHGTVNLLAVLQAIYAK